MIQTRKFSVKVSRPITHPDAHGLSASMIQLPEELASHFSEEALTKRYDGLPIILGCSNTVVSLYLTPHGEMHEHPAPEPILAIVIAGKGFMRIGGPAGETMEVAAGEAVLWPANTDHKAWTEADSMNLLVFHYEAK